MNYFFRVEHDLLRSEAFKTLGGSAIKVYLVIGLYSDFGTDWAFPSIRTIAKQAGLSRQTVLAAIEQLTRVGLLAASKAKGRSTAYRIIRQAPERPSRSKTAPNPAEKVKSTGLISLDQALSSGPRILRGGASKWSRSWTSGGPGLRPDRPGKSGPNENQHRETIRQHQCRSPGRRSA